MLEIHHLEKPLTLGEVEGQMSQEGLGVFEHAVEAGEVGEGGEEGAQGGLGGEVAFGQILSCQDDEDGQGDELCEGSFLTLLGSGEAGTLGLQGFEFVIYPDVCWLLS
ncbi:hypothetical protein [Meiothermus taiwanensis]|uniref:hypothetical protein n=1 Tax=Meiothermus taiwanensis TaxID=172827 RepID=UPI00041D32BC|nr:hypothetical protein [Meiothermus taiwanensis]